MFSISQNIEPHEYLLFNHPSTDYLTSRETWTMKNVHAHSPTSNSSSLKRLLAFQLSVASLLPLICAMWKRSRKLQSHSMLPSTDKGLMSGINASTHEETRESLLPNWNRLQGCIHEGSFFPSLHKEGSKSWPSIIITSKKRQSADKLESPVCTCMQMQKLEDAQKIIILIIPTEAKLYFS